MTPYRTPARQPVRCACGWAHPTQFRTKMQSSSPDANIVELVIVCPDCGKAHSVPLSDSYTIPADEVSARVSGEAGK